MVDERLFFTKRFSPGYLTLLMRIMTWLQQSLTTYQLKGPLWEGRRLIGLKARVTTT